jgi:small subunit ribosomal protein S2e
MASYPKVTHGDLMFGGVGRGGFGRGGFGRGRGRGSSRVVVQPIVESPTPFEWIPLTKLGRAVKAGRIKQIEEVFLYSLPIKEHEMMSYLLPSTDWHFEVLHLAPVRRRTAAGQVTTFKCYLIVGDRDIFRGWYSGSNRAKGVIGLGVGRGKSPGIASRNALIDARIDVVPIRRGYWGNKLGMPHTVPMKVTGKSGSVSVRMVPAPRGTGIVAAPVIAKILQCAGIEDMYTRSKGKTRTRGNFIKAAFNALKKTYQFLTPDLWPLTVVAQPPTADDSAPSLFKDSFAPAAAHRRRYPYQCARRYNSYEDDLIE